MSLTDNSNLLEYMKAVFLLNKETSEYDMNLCTDGFSAVEMQIKLDL